jgi:hypothetical protein
MKMVRELRSEGFTVEITGNCHLKITHPNMDGPVFSGSSPSCQRANKNLKATIKRKMKNQQ